MFGLLAGGVTAFAAGAPILVEAVAGLALLNAFGSALHNALADTQEREAALVAFLVTASGVSIYGVGGAFWGLIVGGVVLFLTRAGASMRLASGAVKPVVAGAEPPWTKDTHRSVARERHRDR